MYADLKNKKVIVTGGAGSIGSAVCKMFLENKAELIVIDKDGKKIKKLRKEVQAKARFIQADISSPLIARQAISQAGEMLGRIDVLVNLAGFAQGGDITETDEETYWKDINNNLTSTFFCIRTAIPFMKEGGGGAIVNVSSINSVIGIGEVSYSAAKAGINSLTKTTAVRYGRYGIHCNSLLLGTIKTNSPSWQKRVQEDPDVFDRIASKIPRKKVGTSSEAAELIIFLASDVSRLINGAEIVADGGWSLAAGTVKEKEGPWWED
jgi:meso-butanediol dehydrogenase / (S,S)-butanediol dehydrogenase / diacetyl reductase